MYDDFVVIVYPNSGAADTLEWLGPAPVYDCGSSLGFDLPTSELRMHANDECKPFARAFEKQLALVSSFDWVDVDETGNPLYPH